jgi:hypothetical protein
VSDIKLRVHDADPERVERIRARCLAVLERRRREVEAHRARVAPPRGWLEPAIAVGLCVLYLAEAFTRALAVFR